MRRNRLTFSFLTLSIFMPETAIRQNMGGRPSHAPVEQQIVVGGEHPVVQAEFLGNVQTRLFRDHVSFQVNSSDRFS